MSFNATSQVTSDNKEDDEHSQSEAPWPRESLAPPHCSRVEECSAPMEHDHPLASIHMKYTGMYDDDGTAQTYS